MHIGKIKKKNLRYIMHPLSHQQRLHVSSIIAGLKKKITKFESQSKTRSNPPQQGNLGPPMSGSWMQRPLGHPQMQQMQFPQVEDQPLPGGNKIDIAPGGPMGPGRPQMDLPFPIRGPSKIGHGQPPPTQGPPPGSPPHQHWNGSPWPNDLPRPPGPHKGPPTGPPGPQQRPPRMPEVAVEEKILCTALPTQEDKEISAHCSQMKKYERHSDCDNGRQYVSAAVWNGFQQEVKMLSLTETTYEEMKEVAGFHIKEDKRFLEEKSRKYDIDFKADKISCCINFTQNIQKIYGPLTSNYLITRHLFKLDRCQKGFLEIPDLKINHPAVKKLIYYAKLQEKDAGGGLNIVLIFTGELLKAADELVKSKIPLDCVISGFKEALDEALVVLNGLCVQRNNTNINESTDGDSNENIINQVYEQEPPLRYFRRHHNRKMYLKSDTIKIFVFSCPFTYCDSPDLTVWKERLSEVSYFRMKMTSLQSKVISISFVGEVVVSVGKPPDQFIRNNFNLRDMILVNVQNQVDIRRICAASGATSVSKVKYPWVGFGTINEISISRIDKICLAVFKIKKENNQTETIVVEDTTESDHSSKTLAADSMVQCVPGAGATALELARRIGFYANAQANLRKTVIKKFSKSLEIFPVMLAECMGYDINEALEKLYGAHENGCTSFGINIFQNSRELVFDSCENNVFESYDSIKYGLIRSYEAFVEIVSENNFS